MPGHHLLAGVALSVLLLSCGSSDAQAPPPPAPIGTTAGPPSVEEVEPLREGPSPGAAVEAPVTSTPTPEGAEAGFSVTPEERAPTDDASGSAGTAAAPPVEVSVGATVPSVEVAAGTSDPGVPATLLPARVSGAKAVDELRSRGLLEAVARINGKTVDELLAILLDATATIDPTGRLLFIDPPPE